MSISLVSYLPLLTCESISDLFLIDRTQLDKLYVFARRGGIIFEDTGGIDTDSYT